MHAFQQKVTIFRHRNVFQQICKKASAVKLKRNQFAVTRRKIVVQRNGIKACDFYMSMHTTTENYADVHAIIQHSISNIEQHVKFNLSILSFHVITILQCQFHLKLLPTNNNQMYSNIEEQMETPISQQLYVHQTGSICMGKNNFFFGVAMDVLGFFITAKVKTLLLGSNIFFSDSASNFHEKYYPAECL